MAQKLNIAILISGRGSNMKALIDACYEPDFPVNVAVVVSDREGAEGLEIASGEGVPAKVVDHTKFPNNQTFDQALHKTLTVYNPDLICCAGFMRLLGASFISNWRSKLINIHPSLLPAYKGLNTHARVLADRARETGCTVHVVTPEMDSGPVILQRKVSVMPGDTEEDIAERVLAEEHIAYVDVVRQIAEGRIKIVDGQVHWS